MNLYFIGFASMNKSLPRHKKTSDTSSDMYEIKRLFPVISCFSSWELMSIWLTWKFEQKGCNLGISMPGSYRQVRTYARGVGV